MSIVDGTDPAALQRAAAARAAGELVAFPTETVYGLGARADDDAAVAKFFAAKGRNSSISRRRLFPATWCCSSTSTSRSRSATSAAISPC